MKISATTRLTGLIGHPVEHSVSPAMHNAAFAALGLDACYIPFPVVPELLPQAVAGLRALNFIGANVTIPYKEAVMPQLHVLSPQAQAIGSVNTLVVRERLYGFNTDADGFLRALYDAGNTLAGKKALVLGAGGAARAIVYALLREEARIVIANRTLERAEELVRHLSPHVTGPEIRTVPYSRDILFEELASVDLLVNTTPIGMWPQAHASPLPGDAPFHQDLVVFDLIYRPLETRLLQQARQAGARVIGGLAMLVWQGAEGFRLWTGYEPPVGVMFQAARAALDE
jgi:shikimate dehydrogenase